MSSGPFRDPGGGRFPGWEEELPRPAGLCARCRRVIVVRSRRSVFVRCRLGDRDDRFPRYPRIPVVACPGFQAVEPSTEKDPGNGRFPSSHSLE
ncbi:MAG: hypothetical protein R3234_04900 [Thermoanaerobaculia bacterium]|nr:hypothetical protein [Thermoanaerobaculia bacterium]